MKRKKGYEERIYLGKLVSFVAYHWRRMLVFGILMACIMGFYQSARLAMIHNKGELTKEEQIYEVARSKYENQIKQYSTTISLTEARLQERNLYKTDSPLMKIDPQNEWEISRRYSVSLDPDYLARFAQSTTYNPVAPVLAAYNTVVKDDLDYTEIEKKFGISMRRYLDEIVTVSTSADTSMITLRVLASTREEAVALMDYFTERLEKMGQEKAGAISEHTLTLLSVNEGKNIDNNLAESQKKLEDDIASYEETLQDTKQQLINLKETGGPSKPGKHIVKYAVSGFAAGLLVIILFYIFSYLMTDKMKTREQLIDQYDLALLGVCRTRMARQPARGIDAFIEKKENKGVVPPERSEELQVIAKAFSDQFKDRTVALVSTLPVECFEDGKEALSAESSKELFVVDRFCDNSQALSVIRKAEVVIVVESCMKSYMSNVSQMMELLSSAGIEVKDAVVL